ncbi:hypothetical protein EXIGLDRAFT_822535 [Exidia glandulosa HHB12029]|uniref:DUF4246 domain-containing protein n=1 Tax=Exidia glandulosa HHB12029 TaxID=1314781 RepID=A0A165JDJ0_EXIGL|nr:hypothetical protein EXIGLDRAFT_822535 [Exidia glandulosa HHB12029]
MSGAPDFPGRAWQVEGMKNEQIVACGFYYYGEEYVSLISRLVQLSERDPAISRKWPSCAVLIQYRSSRDDLLVQDLGHVETPAGRCIAFPNVFQHNVYPCSLADESQPGYRKVLALFLVDPDVRIPSTSNTGVQDPEFIMDLLKQAGPESPLSKLPDELLAMIVSYYPFFTRREAEVLRTELVEERQRSTFDMHDHSSRGFFGGRY